MQEPLFCGLKCCCFPTGNLDRATGKAIIAMLKELAADGMTIIYVSHDLEMVAEATRSIHIVDSRLVG
ncbi:MAG: hypothetical protein V2B20_28550, partial [Pseudomonadota bacterium]